MKCRKVALFLLLVTVLSSAILLLNMTNVKAGGCTYWKLHKRGKPYCSDIPCPGGFVKRKLRADIYTRECIGNLGAYYDEFKTETVFLGCECP